MKFGRRGMAKLKTNVRLKIEESEKLRDKAWELTMKSKQQKKMIQEPDIVHFILSRCVELVDVDENGEMYLHDIEDFK